MRADRSKLDGMPRVIRLRDGSGAIERAPRPLHERRLGAENSNANVNRANGIDRSKKARLASPEPRRQTAKGSNFGTIGDSSITSGWPSQLGMQTYLNAELRFAASTRGILPKELRPVTRMRIPCNI
ncbi:hypothetical protein R1flu_001951 [Riccia fluitans]|uniref:Uncharacterized protein n=1 Tax=Riccia fluitans TaxID=41844 RepID=A0ABD1Y4R5_9MARC